MDPTLTALFVTAATIGLLHTLAGPDHYVPFIAMARARDWSARRTVAVTLACGAGHVAGSVILGFVGISIGLALGWMESFESARGTLAGWLLIGFGVAYAAWGLRRAWKNRTHSHWHHHADGTVHDHEHDHHGAHAHVHTAEQLAGRPEGAPTPGHTQVGVQAEAAHTHGHQAAEGAGAEAAHTSGHQAAGGAGAAAAHAHPAADHDHGASGGKDGVRSVTPWVLFLIFVFGPCEPLIPVLMVPAAEGSWWAVAAVAGVFGLCTLAAMTAAVIVGYYGLGKLSLGPTLERYSHALAGAALAACGLAVQLGL